ncbi:MAG: UDP-N-acetylmuramoyl-tripeptide--D-alanyl-D-alanine ligase, partial [Thermoleophilaceae bacterium]|nr:UDP-N-acetylmuramoyl-tripeptide--D-alanyl-D-alanine ligase [Thermoleophilaceae bacterium]
MIDRTAGWVASAAGGRLVAGDPEERGPRRAVVDSREVHHGDLFVGLAGSRDDGGRFAAAALESGAWGAIVSSDHASALAGGARPAIVAEDPLAALQSLAREWRRLLGCPVAGVTGSTGKTSTKDILTALLRQQWPATHANRENLNTEIGLPLTVLAAELGTDAMVLEMAMRGEGQIAELAEIAEPDVGVIVNVGPVHLEILGTVERVAAAKAELIRDLRPGAACVVPASEPLLEAHLRDDLDTWTFGPGGQVQLLAMDGERAEIEARGERIELDLPYREPHNLLNTLAAVAAARALGIQVGGAVNVRFSSLRGEVV